MGKDANRKEEIKRAVFDQDHIVWRVLASFMDLVFVSLMWFFCSLPVITIGAATTAAYDVTVHCVRRKEPGMLARFLSTFKAEFKNATLSTLIWGLALAFLVFLLLFIPYMEDGSLSFLFMIDAVILAVLVFGSITWVFPIFSRFEMGLWKANKAAIKLIFANFAVSLIMIAAMILTIAACYIWLFPLIFLPGLLWLLQSVFIEKVFLKLQAQEG